MTVKLLTEHHLEFLSLKGGCSGWPESTHVKIPHCLKSHVAAHINNEIAPLGWLETGVHIPLKCSVSSYWNKMSQYSMSLLTLCEPHMKFWYGKCSKISSTFLFLFSNINFGFQGWHSQNACQNSKQGRSRSDCFFRRSLIWVCAVCLGLFGRQLVFEIL